MVRRVRWSRAAQLDLEELFEFIAGSAPVNASRLATRIKKASETLDILSERGRIVPEFHDDALREIFVSRYRIMYRLSEKEVIIAAVIHMSRDLQSIFHSE